MQERRKLKIIGVGEAFDTGLGNNSCLLTAPAKGALLFDCGYQIPERLWREPRLARSIDAVFLSHLHADHAFGIVPLLMRYWEEGRKRPLWLIGHRGLRAYVRELFNLGYPGLFKKLGFRLEFREVIDGSRLRWKDLELRFASTRHSVDNLSVRVDGHGWSLGFSGDGALTRKGEKLFEDVDLLIQEVFTPTATIPVHYDLQSLREYSDRASIGRIGVTHCSRDFKNRIESAVKRLARADRRWIWLRPGMEISVYGRDGRSGSRGRSSSRAGRPGRRL